MLFVFLLQFQVAGGGGGGGRISVHVTSENSYRGEYEIYGGKGFSEGGGSGTVYVKAPSNDTGNIESTLTIDNQNSVPNNIYIDNVLEDSCRTYVITSDGNSADDTTFDHVYINRDGHLAFRKTSSSESVVDVTISKLHGDLTGMIHTSVEQKISIVDSDSPIPASLRVYDNAMIQLPEGNNISPFI